ncbi:hypothetical protein [Salinigranum halophilum]|jgi:hypothetical protein|uniref:hypothetical protein n=1 Tax=Salinigranum halophilum TaxID=2565931 RepID=UPI00115E8105|nr:hypothetical protein [Salinigranum halophilum]
MTPPTTPNQTSNVGGAAVVNRRVVKRIEARNERASSPGRGAFDFVVEGGTADDLTLGLLASYLGAAAARRSATLDIALDVSRVVVEVEHGRAQSDGGAVESPGEDGHWRAGRERTPRRVRAIVEAHTDGSTDRLTAWRDQLVGDDVPFEMVPGLVGVDLLVTPRSGTGDGTDDSPESAQ